MVSPLRLFIADPREIRSEFLGENRSIPALKICGLTDPDQAMAIAAMGVQAIGVIGVAATPRFLESRRRCELFESLRKNYPDVARVFVVADADNGVLDQALSVAGAPTVIQLHGSESPKRCSELRQRHPEVKWWKALRIRNEEDLALLNRFSDCTDALLLDAWSPDQLGGTGHRLPLEWLAETEPTCPWWLAGGICAEWIPELLNRVNPHGLDASSRLESSPGVKELSKVKALVEAVQNNRLSH